MYKEKVTKCIYWGDDDVFVYVLMIEFN